MTQVIEVDFVDVVMSGFDEATRMAMWRQILAEIEPTELPDDEIIPDETRPLEDEPVKTDQVPEE